MKILEPILSLVKFLAELFFAYLKGRRDGIEKAEKIIADKNAAAANALENHKNHAKTKQDDIKKTYDDARARLRDS